MGQPGELRIRDLVIRTAQDLIAEQGQIEVNGSRGILVGRPHPTQIGLNLAQLPSQLLRGKVHFKQHRGIQVIWLRVATNRRGLINPRYSAQPPEPTQSFDGPGQVVFGIEVRANADEGQFNQGSRSLFRFRPPPNGRNAARPASQPGLGPAAPQARRGKSLRYPPPGPPG